MFLSLDRVYYIAVYGRVREHSECIKKYLNSSYENEQRSHRFGTI